MITRVQSRFAARGGMTLIEMLVATTATLILMGAVAQIFSVFGSAVTNSRSMIEMDARMRTVAWRLRSDLAGATARPIPPLSPASGEGYLEIIEGPLNDASAAAGSTSLAADVDDVILFTTSATDTPFLGKAGSAMVESPTAEVAWFLRATAGTSPATYTLFRRQLLVVGYAGFQPFATNFNTVAFTAWNTFFDSYDLSVRREGSLLIPNSLADLTRRECRFMHNPNGVTNGSGFPYAFTTGAGVFFDSSLSSTRVGDDVVLTNVIEFDVRVFDPAAPVNVSGTDATVPGDPGYTATAADANGCYVDLGNGAATAGPSGVNPHFSGTGLGPGLAGQRTYDTWSTHYEGNGVDEDGDGVVDEGTNGIDDNNNGFVDEVAEQETSPPYPFPLRGLEIRIRCYEPASRQVRQVTVRHTFVPH
jgi:type II secretory pathway component PulJ